MPATTAFELLRPFLWLATVAFLTGFAGYLALGGAATALVATHQQSPAALVSGPASDDWNLPKRI